MVALVVPWARVAIESLTVGCTMRIFNLFTRWFRMDAYSLSEITKRLDTIIEQQRTLIRIGVRTMAHFERLVAEVTRAITVKESAIVLITQVVAELRALKEQGEITPEQLEALADALAAKTDQLAAAVVAGTVAEDEENGDDNGGGEEPQSQQRRF